MENMLAGVAQNNRPTSYKFLHLIALGCNFLVLLIVKDERTIFQWIYAET